MLQLDFFSITMAVSINLMAVALAAPWYLNKKISRASNRGQQFLLLQGLAWVLILAASNSTSRLWTPVLLQTSVIIAMTAQWRLGRAVQGWLGPRPQWLAYALAGTCILGALGPLALMSLPPWSRHAWFCASYGLSFLLIGAMALRPAKQVGRLWRFLLIGSCLGMALILLLRSYGRIPGVDLSSLMLSEAILQQWLSTATPIFCTLMLLVIALAWRDELVREARSQDHEDDLTGLPDRYTLMRQAQGLLRRSQRASLPLSVVLIDLDHFRQINRQYGYETGNEALQLLSLVLKKHMRGDELAARFDGESFCLLVHADAFGVQSLLTRLRSALQLGLQHKLNLYLDFSAGCVHVPEVWTELEMEDLLHEARAALHRAKRAGQGGLNLVTLQAPHHEEPEGKPTKPAVPSEQAPH